MRHLDVFRGSSAHGRGVRTIEEVFALEPFAKAIYEELQRTGPASVLKIASNLGADPDDVEEAVWWLKFGDTNGSEDLLVARLATWVSVDGFDQADLLFAYVKPMEHGAEIVSEIIRSWRDEMDRVNSW